VRASPSSSSLFTSRQRENNPTIIFYAPQPTTAVAATSTGTTPFYFDTKMQRYGLLIILAAFTADAFLPHQRLVQNGRRHAFASTTYSASSLEMVSGFGASSNKNNKKGGSNKKKDVKLKPRQQWDRYADLKPSESVRVAVRIIDIDIDSSEQQQQQQQQWLQVGAVKSKDNAYTEAAVIRHRVLIAEHARRIFPLQISAKDKLEWAYSSDTAATAQEEGQAEWVVAGKVENVPDDIDKLIGFEGLADPTGFYARSTEKLGYRSVADFDNMMKKGVLGHVDFQ
jgi:hypothetical protein